METHIINPLPDQLQYCCGEKGQAFHPEGERAEPSPSEGWGFPLPLCRDSLTQQGGFPFTELWGRVCLSVAQLT